MLSEALHLLHSVGSANVENNPRDHRASELVWFEKLRCPGGERLLKPSLKPIVVCKITGEGRRVELGRAGDSILCFLMEADRKGLFFSQSDLFQVGPVKGALPTTPGARAARP